MEDTNREEAREEVEEEACIIIIIIIIISCVVCFLFAFFCVHVLVLAVSFLVSFYKTKGNTHKSRDTKKEASWCSSIEMQTTITTARIDLDVFGRSGGGRGTTSSERRTKPFVVQQTSFSASSSSSSSSFSFDASRRWLCNNTFVIDATRNTMDERTHQTTRT